MKKRGGIAAAITLGMFTLPAAALALCVAIVTGAITINGIVVSTNLPAGPGNCQGDPGWAGVVGVPFHRLFPDGTDPADRPVLFLAGQGTPLSKFYVGVHVPHDPMLSRDDHVTLYFDADNSNSITTGDFALVYDVGKDIVITTQESCDSVPALVRKYTYNGTDWGTAVASPAGVTSKFAFDYDNTDVERDIWELEVQLDATTVGLTAPFKMGVKVIQEELISVGNHAWQTWVYPPGLTAQSDPQFIFPDDGDVTPAAMQSIQLGGCADVTIDKISSRAGSSDNAFYPPRPGDWNIDGSLPANLQTHFSADVRFYNPADPSDNSVVGSPNTGTAQFKIRPYGSGSGFLGERVMQTPGLSFTALGQTRTLSFDWPRQHTDYAPIEALIGASDHSCLEVTLGGFLVNLPAGDLMDLNLYYVTLSNRVDTFLVSTRSIQFRKNAAGIPTEGTNPTYEFLIRSSWRNVPDASANGWSYKITPADTFGPVKDLGNGYYSFQMRGYQDRRLQVEMNGGTMPVSSTTYTVNGTAGGAVVNPGDGNAAIPVAVKQGQIVTIVAGGKTRVLTDSLRNGADGRFNREYRNQPFLLDGNFYDPSAHIGALIGSFDGRKGWFVIGADKSFLVPPGATTLWLAVNDLLKQYHDNTGSFTVSVFLTGPHSLPTQLLTPTNPAIGQPVMANPATDLPQLDIDVFQSLGLTSYRGKPAPQGDRLLLPASYLVYAVTATHTRPGGGGQPGGGGLGCSSENAEAFATFLGISVFGVVLNRRRQRSRRSP
jgi:hypothetical protein